MSASKKSKSTTNSPTPASKSASTKPAPKKVPARAATVKSETPSPVAMLAPKSGEEPAVAIKAIAPKSVGTTINARVDVGFGNALFLRGEGPGLNWEKSLAMECVGPDLWSISLAESARAFTFKFLINDLTWSTGPDFTAAGGTNVTLTPEF